jgi:hypothetical protein
MPITVFACLGGYCALLLVLIVGVLRLDCELYL